MTRQQYNKLKKLIDEAEKRALNEGIDITSKEFDLVIDEILKSKGFTLVEYNRMEEAKPPEPEKIIPEGISQIKGEKGDKGDRGDRGEAGRNGEDGKNGKDGRDGKDGKRGKDGKDGIDGRDGKDANPQEIVKELKGYISNETKGIKDYLSKKMSGEINEFAKNFQYNMDIISEGQKRMPDFRKLAMGLQAQINSISSPTVIDLDSQCDGSRTEFDLGRKINGVMLVNNNGGILTSADYTLNSAKNKITLVYAPTSGEELEVIALI